MKKNTIEFIRHTCKGNELLESWELGDRHFARCDYRDSIANLLFYAGQGPRFHTLSARLKTDDRTFLTISCNTKAKLHGTFAEIRTARPREKFEMIKRAPLPA